jgi:hypothetical protein
VSANRYQSSFNDIGFNRLYDDSAGAADDPSHQNDAYRQSDYRLEALDLSRVTVEDFREMRQFLEGAEANEAYEGVLVAILRGTILGSSYNDLEDKTWALRAAFSPANVRLASRSTDPKNVLPFDFKVDSAAGISSRRLYCRPAVGRPVMVWQNYQGLGRRFLIQLISFDPKVVSQTLHQQAASLGGQVIANAGNFMASTKIRITFSGAGNAALTITNSTIAQTLVINATTAANGEIWEIDTKAGTIVRVSDNANRFSQRISGYISSLYLPAGNSTWAFANTGGVSAIRFDYRDAWA